MRKKRVLVITEATYLNTGYAADGREILSHMQKSGKYDIAEFSIYGSADDPRRASIPWPNYSNAPCNDDDEETKRSYHSNPVNQFGAWRFERVCLDFKPDCAKDLRDSWMSSFVKQSPYRNLFHWAWKSTVDAAGQNPEWISQFASTDSFLTLTEWGQNVVKSQGDHINFAGVAGIPAHKCFVPVPKVAHRLSMGLNPDWKIIGTVMRNQRRKLFPELFEAFGKYLRKTQDLTTYLYCHTSYPDNGWDIPQLMSKEGISSRVLFTYACQCGKLSTGLFADAVQQCRHCKNFSAKLSNVTNGATVEELAKIYQCFDVYIQCANSEGFGCGVTEAASCGIPTMATDYSAMSETVRKTSGFPIPVLSMSLELETGCYRAKPDVDAIVSEWERFFSQSEDIIDGVRKDTRASYEAHYDWDKVAKVWMDIVDSCEYAKWDHPFRQINIPSETPKFKTNKEFLDWAIPSFLPYSNMKNSYEAMQLLRDLNFGCHKNGPCGYFYSDNSYMNMLQFSKLERSDVVNILKQKAEIFNFWEKARSGEIQFKQESWLADRNNM